MGCSQSRHIKAQTDGQVAEVVIPTLRESAVPIPSFQQKAAHSNSRPETTSNEGGLRSNHLQSSSSPSTSISHALDLASLRQEMVLEGDIAKTVVRIEAQFGTPIEKIYDGVRDGPILGSGVSGVVRLCVHRTTGTEYAVKCLDLGAVNSIVQLQALRNEISIMCQLDHPFIVRINEVYESLNEIYIVQELCRGGDLFDRLDDQPDDAPYYYTEAQCARLVQQMLMAIGYLHNQSIVHRDLKLENFLFSTKESDSVLKLIDFGLSKHFKLGECHHELVGTPYTVAPEIIKGKYTEKCDVWAIGVITFLLLCGEAPFGGIQKEDDLRLVREKITRAEVLFEPADIWDNVSPEAKAFVKRLLEADEAKRPHVKDILHDPWIQTWAMKDAKGGNGLNVKTVQNLISFKEKSDVQKLLSEVLSFTLQPDQVSDLRQEFESLDTDKDGEISLKEVRMVLMESAEAGQLGSMTEKEVDDIFNAMKTRKNELTIRWHEFLAAALSLSRVDESSLRLAFDRLDTNRRGYLSFADLQNLLGDSTESLEQEWRETLQDCIGTCKDDRITFQDFKRLLKRRPRIEPSAPPPLGRPRRAATVASYTDVGISEPQHDWGRMERRLSSRFVLPAQAAAGEADSEVLRQSSATPMVANRALYRRHRAMRLSVLDASKKFDRQRSQRLSEAGLIMQRGAKTPLELEDEHTRKLYEAASQRCGRGRRTKYRTMSDVTGMILKPTTK